MAVPEDNVFFHNSLKCSKVLPDSQSWRKKSNHTGFLSMAALLDILWGMLYSSCQLQLCDAFHIGYTINYHCVDLKRTKVHSNVH